MKQITLSDLRRRYGPKVVWYSILSAGLSIVLAVLCIELSLGYLMKTAEHNATLGEKRSRLHAISTDLVPLRTLRKEIGDTRSSIAGFYAERVPATYSQVISNLGDIAIRSGVSLSHVSYSQGTPGSDLSELSMEVAVAGDYAQLVRFVNGVERDRIFFVVRALSFTGQQGGDVTLQVRISTWLRSQPRPDALMPADAVALPAAAVPAAKPIKGGR